MTDAAEVRRLTHRVLMPGFAGTQVPRWLAGALHEGLGGICLFGHNIESPAQLCALTDDAHGLGPVVVGVDEEGGIVSRLGARTGSRHVGAAALGVVDDVALTEAVAGQIAIDLRAVGVDLDLAPVADVTSDLQNPVIGVRSFGTEPEHVARHTRAFVQGLQRLGVAACAKHFPGHGDTSVDSHAGLPRIAVDLETLRRRELLPFAAAVEAGVQVVMTAHIVFEALDDRPATVSAPVMRLLRDELRFDGVITSDAMDMGAIVDSIGLAEGCVQAVVAGVDLVGLGNPVLNAPQREDERTFVAALDALVEAATSGRLPLERLRQAAGRVDRLERWCRDRRESEIPAGKPETDARAARASLRTVGDVAGVLSGPVRVVDVRRRRNIAAGGNTGLIAHAIVERLPGSEAMSQVPQATVAEGRASAAERTAAPGAPEEPGAPGAGAAVQADVVVTGTPSLDPAEAEALARIVEANPRAVVVCTGMVPPGTLAADRVVHTFGDSLPTARAVVDLLAQ
ncbi:glycoside hydrolase family 3 N-terminal domain-containing protein [Luteipulveratus sp. YIM 133132]|uniref:glycoside hydrolase family 3 protein n=1 Tax=Luteipulveratus flavus TaxID=3031728 RepID=UPI0023B1B108|nr:glycoside hydrolase family 3 N-terminal domain-containing protein [Luteipulveratus sp. YIM 133132]MDE9367598.1 glycoside hydrolase family 3 N-terminal domain-containing protein [Luteipulveratus sp. YIM 133132]